MWCNQIFSLLELENTSTEVNGIVDNTEEITESIEETEPVVSYVIRNIIVCDNFEVASQIARNAYGETAIAIDTTDYPVSIGHTYFNGRFYDSDNIEILSNGIQAQIRNLQNIVNTQSDTITYLEQQNTDLLGCLLEMSELVYA